jgi:site-specific recombinase XerD
VHTRANYREDLQAFAGWYEHRFRDAPTLALLAPSELRQWKAHFRDEQKMEPATVHRKLAAPRSLLRWAESEGIAPEITP